MSTSTRPSTLARSPAAGPVPAAAGHRHPRAPLALDTDRQFDKQSQRAAGWAAITSTLARAGLAVGVHSTQFAIREVGTLSARPRARHRDGA